MKNEQTNPQLGSVFKISAERLLLGSTAVFVVCVLVALIQFWPWMPTVFFGDDLSNFLAYRDHQFASSIGQALTGVYAEKYRPLFSLIIGGLFQLFGGHIKYYLILNILIQAAAATLMFRISFRLNRSVLVSLMVALAAASSRFSLYQVTQVTGILESVSLLLFLVMLESLISAERQAGGFGSYRYCWIATFYFFMAIQIHERYIVIFAGLFLAAFAFERFQILSRAKALLIMAASVAAALSNVLYKKLILHSDFFVGTGGTHMTIDMNRTVSQLMQSLVSIFGFNAGPEYLVAEPYSQYHTDVEWYLGWTFFICLMALILGGVLKAGISKKSLGDKLRTLFLPTFFFVLIGLMLLPPILTIRMEQRWLVVPFYLLLLIAAWAANFIGSPIKILLMLAVTASSISLDAYISSRFSNLFFVSAGQFATLVKRDIIDKNPLGTYPILFIAEKSRCRWSLLGGKFFLMYAHKLRQVQCVDAGAIDYSKLQPGTRVFAVVKDSN